MIENPAAIKTNVLNLRRVRWAFVLGVFAWAVFAAAPAVCEEVTIGGAYTASTAVTEPAEASDDAPTTESAEADDDTDNPEDDYIEFASRSIKEEIDKVGTFQFILNIFFNIRGFLDKILSGMGPWAYVILWSILFMETGLVVMAFLPGDSLLFAAGTLAMWGDVKGYPLNLYLLLPILISGPICGDSCNYWIGRLFGHRIMSKENPRFFKKSHIEKAHAFYERHGGKAVAIGRFLPLIRTFVPFVAGVGGMDYKRFLGFSVVGSILWICVCVLAGWAFGSQPFVKEHFETVIIAIVLISLTPAIITFLRSRRAAKKQAAVTAKAEDATKP